MPEINEHLEKIINGVYGQEIRGSIYDAINTINNSINNMGNLHFTIAPSNAVNKDRADLVLNRSSCGRFSRNKSSDNTSALCKGECRCSNTH